MKKIARWAFAFAAVMSVSGSAMAIDNFTFYDVTMKNGPAVVHNGSMRFALLDYDMSIFSGGCVSAGTWCVGSPMSCSTLMAREELMIGYGSCEDLTYGFADTIITDYVDPRIANHGYDVRRQKKKIVRLALTQDGVNGMIKGMCHLGSPMNLPTYISLAPVAHP